MAEDLLILDPEPRIVSVIVDLLGPDINEYKTARAVDQWNNRCAFAGLPLARDRRLLMFPA